MQPPVRSIAIVIFVGAALYLLGNAGISLWDRDEPHYAQASRQMLESGDWVVPRYLDDVRTAKPIFIYWLQAASMKLIGKDGDAGAFAARLPSAIAMTIVLSIMAVVLCRGVADRRHAFWAVFIMSTCGLTLWSAKACTTDGVLLIGMVVAQFCLYRIWRGDASWPVMLALALAIAEAGLTKGPVVLGVMGMTILALGLFRWLDRKRPDDERFLPEPLPRILLPKLLITILIAAALLAPWLLMIRARAAGFLEETVSHDVLKRSYQPLEGHKGPPGYHLALIFATYFPWSVLLPMTIIVAWRERRDPQVRFALAAVLGPWVMFEIVVTKLPHYMMPTFPALAFLTARVIVKCLNGEKDDLVRRPMVVASAVIGLAAIAIGASTVYAAKRFDESTVPAIALLVVAIGFALAVFVTFAQKRPRHGLLAMGMGMIALYAVLFGFYLPRAQFLHLSKQTADALARASGEASPKSEMLDYKEPSMAYYQGGTIRQNSAMSLTPDVAARSAAWLVITQEVWDKTPPSVQALYEIRETRTGLAYADGGRTVKTLVVRKR